MRTRILALAVLGACAADAPAPVIPKPQPDDPGALVLVIDRSGSMTGPKLEAAKQAVTDSVMALDAIDQVAVVAFDSEPRVVVALQPSTGSPQITATVAAMTAGGGTNVTPALRIAYDLLRPAQAKIKHVIVLSDGEAPTEGLVELVRDMRRDRITISTVGVQGADANLLLMLSTEGGGRMYHVDDLARLPQTFVEETRLALR